MMKNINKCACYFTIFGLFLMRCAPKKASISEDFNPIIDNKCIKPINDIKKPIIVKVGQFLAAIAKSKSNPPVSDYAIVELEILNYDKNFPPVIKIFDEQTNQQIDSITFRSLPYPCEPVISTPLKVPIFLSYDKTPWKRPDQEPQSRITRIELPMKIINQVDIVYIQLKKGVFVVPVVWHNVTTSSNKGISYVNNNHIKDMFWTAPTGMNFNDINSIWAQADIQFRLLSLNVPFRLSNISTHVLNKSSANNCTIGWNANISDKNGVDIYGVYDLKFQGSNVSGVGNCFNEGRILIDAGQNSLFTSKNTQAGGRAALVAHEFGHYLGSLPHNLTDPDNLMQNSPGWKISSSQRQLVRKRLKEKIMQVQGYNEIK